MVFKLVNKWAKKQKNKKQAERHLLNPRRHLIHHKRVVVIYELLVRQ